MTRDEALDHLSGSEDEEAPLTHEEAVALLTAAYRDRFGVDPNPGAEVLIECSARSVRDGHPFEWWETSDGARVIRWRAPAQDGA